MATINEISEQLHKLNENIVLIYALNSTGKTRLSVAYKDYTKAIELNVQVLTEDAMNKMF